MKKLLGTMVIGLCGIN